MKDYHKMRFWLEGKLINPQAVIWSGERFATGIWNYEETFIVEGMQAVEVELCTGLKDKNGKLIYEGDIISFEGDYGKTILKTLWERGEACFKFIGFDDKGWTSCYGDELNSRVIVEIIGNIHENPELLETK